MVHKSAGSALDCFQHVKADGFDEGRLLTVKIRPDKGPTLFVTNVYNHVAAEGKQQQALPDQLGARLLHTESLGHVHLAGGDYNASLFPEARKGYSNSCETKAADVRFQKFTLDPQKSRQNGENVNPFGAMASVAGDQSGPWTGWIGPAPV